MTRFSDPLRGSPIRVTATGEGSEARWPVFARGRSAAVWTAIAAVALGGGAIALVVDQSLPYGWTERVLSVAAILAAATVMAVAMCLRYRQHLTESIELAGDYLVYSHPFAKGEAQSLLKVGRSWPMVLAAPAIAVRVAREVAALRRGRHRVYVSRDAVSDVRLEGRGRFGHVTIASSEEDLDIGRALSEEDRRWLRDALRAWAGL